MALYIRGDKSYYNGTSLVRLAKQLFNIKYGRYCVYDWQVKLSKDYRTGYISLSLEDTHTHIYMRLGLKMVLGTVTDFSLYIQTKMGIKLRTDFMCNLRWTIDKH